MNNVALLRPELLLGPNPFLEALPPPITFKDLPRALQRSAFSDLPVWAIEPALRESLIETVDTHFVSTSLVLEPACGIQILLRRALAMRNPLEKNERIRVNRIGVCDNDIRVIWQAMVDGAGMMLSGMTASGKSALLHRMLELLAPEQVIDFGSSEACGWFKLKQCVYLYVDQPSNGTRGGLLKRILLQLDKALGTDYFEQHKRTTNLDTLLVVVCKLLTLHRVAMLIVDEKQEQNFADSPWAIEFVLFYLMLMNLGISVVLAGNPLAFEHLCPFSQVMRRFSTGGKHELEPATPSDRWWSRDFIPSARKADLIDHWNIGEVERAELEFRHSGGVPGLYMALHKEVMRQALRRGGKDATVTAKDYAAAVASPRYVEVKRIALSISEANAQSVSDFVDIPPLRHKRGGTPKASSIPCATMPAIELARVVRLLTNFKSTQTKLLNTETRRIKVLQSLSPEDARWLANTDDLLASMEGLKTTVESAKKNGGKRGLKVSKDGAP